MFDIGPTSRRTSSSGQELDDEEIVYGQARKGREGDSAEKLCSAGAGSVRIPPDLARAPLEDDRRVSGRCRIAHDEIHALGCERARCSQTEAGKFERDPIDTALKILDQVTIDAAIGCAAKNEQVGVTP